MDPFVNGKVPLPRSTLSSSDPSHDHKRGAGLTPQDVIVKALAKLTNLTTVEIQIACFHADLREKAPRKPRGQASSSALLHGFIQEQLTGCSLSNRM